MDDHSEPSSYFNVRGWLQSHRKERCQPVRYSQPTPLGIGWTASASGCSHGSATGLLPLALPATLPVDLNAWQGERYIPKPDTHTGMLEVLLREMAAANADLQQCDVITFRNNLNKIFGTAIDPKNDWTVDACFVGSTLLLEIVTQEDADTWARSEQAATFDRWGRAFEAVCMGEHVCDASKEYALLVRTKIDDTRVVMGAEIDCYEASEEGGALGPNGTPMLNTFVELKTYKPPSHPGQVRTLNQFKHAKWWLQSFLAGVPKLMIGGRDDAGLIHTIEPLATADLPRISRRNGAQWDANDILAFGSACLQWMRAVGRTHPGQHLRFVYDAQKQSVQFDVLAEGDLPGRIQTCLAASGLAAS